MLQLSFFWFRQRFFGTLHMRHTRAGVSHVGTRTEIRARRITAVRSEPDGREAWKCDEEELVTTTARL